MTRCMFPAFLFAFAFALLANDWLPAQTVQLADGRVLLADVESADGDGLRVKRLDNGGQLDLRWNHLSTASALSWKKKFDLAGDSHDEITVRVHEVEFVRDGGKRTLIGRVTDQGSDVITVMVKGVPNRIPRAELRAMRAVDAPVTQVLTRQEFYDEQLAARQPGTEADKHVLFAEELIKVRDYDHATEHLAKAKELGSKNPAHVEALIARLERFKAAAKELKAIEEIQACRSRGDLGSFEKGHKLVAQYEKDFPAATSKLKTEFETEKKRFTDARTRYLKGMVAEKWRGSVQMIAEKAIGNPSLTLQGARDYAQSKMTDDIVARLVTVLRLDAEEIKTLWAARKDVPLGKRTELFSYGVGSWVLGDTAIFKDTAAGKEANKQKDKANEPAAGNDPQMERFAKLLKQALERRRQSVQGQASNDEEQTDEDWWREAERTERIGWLRAFYAEFGGQMVVTFATTSPCISCYGEGTVPEIGGDGKMIRNGCFLCHKTKSMRSFRAF